MPIENIKDSAMAPSNKRKLSLMRTFKLNEDDLNDYDTDDAPRAVNSTLAKFEGNKLDDKLDVDDIENEDNDDENENDDDDEFFLAISSTRKLQTGSCPEFYWYPTIPFSAVLTSNSALIDSNILKQKSSFDISSAMGSLVRRRTKSVNDLSYSTIKSYENITHNNYVQMVNSMINGAISDVADPEYVEYVRRHIQGLFDNYTPVLVKSKSNEEMTINSPSRDKIVDIINQSIPKSYSFDLKLLEETKLDNEDNYDAMNFAKFGLGIAEYAEEDSIDEKLEPERKSMPGVSPRLG